MSAVTRDVFFYGLFMDERLLRDKGISARVGRRAVVPGYRLVIGRRAMLGRHFGGQAFGMVFPLTEREIEALYAEPGLEMYRAEPVVVAFEDGRFAAATTFNLAEGSAAGEPDADYAKKLRAVLERLGLPADSIP